MAYISQNQKDDDRELTKEELSNLTGFFDVLIQMDLEQKRKAKHAEEKKFQIEQVD